MAREAGRDEEEEDAGEEATENGDDGEEDDAMDGEEDRDEGNDDFHPLLPMPCSPSADPESGESSTLVCEAVEDADDDAAKIVGNEGREDGSFDEQEGVQHMFRDSEEFMGELDGDDKFFELATDYEEEEFDDMDQEEEDREYLEDFVNGMDYEEGLFIEEGNPTALQTLDGLDGNGCSVSAGDVASGTNPQGDNTDEDAKVGEEYIAPCNSTVTLEVEGKVVGSDGSEEQRDGIMDPICKRTRARYSLADMSLNQLETFLQESEEEEDFQTVAEKEEYEKFLRGVLEDEESSEQPEQSIRKEDEDDEEEDMDFDVEIEEALESDDTTESVRRSRIETRKRPETREKKRRRALLQSRGPLRQLLPHVVGLPKRNLRTENGSMIWPVDGKTTAPASGFTAHQIGQLFCMMHEHVQLLVQVHSVCVFDPTKEQIAKDTKKLLEELVKQRESVLSWKKTAFPDLCFRPPYTHPSPPMDGEKPVTLLDTLKLPLANPFISTSLGQSGQITSNMTFSHSSGQNMSSICPRPYPFPQNLDYMSAAAQHYGVAWHMPQQSTVMSQSWQEGVHPLGAWVPNSDPRHRGQSAFDGASSSVDRTTSDSYTAVTSSTGVDPGSRIACPLVSADDQLHPPSRGSFCDPLSVTASYCQSSVTSSEEPQGQPFIYSNEDCSSPPVANCGPTTTAQCATSGEGGSVYQSLVDGSTERVRSGWAPVVSGPVRSLLDVAPLALVGDFLTNISRVVQELRKRQVEVGASVLDRVPIFAVTALDEQDQSSARSLMLGQRSHLLGEVEVMQTCRPPPRVKKTMAAVLVESTKKQDPAPVPKEIAGLLQQFVPYFNIEMFPRKPLPASTTDRTHFNDWEDELLAMGVMEFNHEWEKIQQRYLPSKTKDQIWLRHKNRISINCVEDNSIKAVHRMKKSPLTDWEMKLIHEALPYYKHDWNKIWSHCARHRNPKKLQFQWRKATGTQKSYKTSDASKERRRLYEAGRRQKLAAQRTSNALSSTEVAPPPVAGIGEVNKSTTESKDPSSPDRAVYRAAVTDGSCKSTRVPGCGPKVATAERQRKQPPKKRKPKTQTGNHFSSSQPWLDSQMLKSNVDDSKQTVKLAPGLPSVKLPPHVQVLSQSQVHPEQYIIANKMGPATSQWVPASTQWFEKSGFSLPIDLQPLSLRTPATATSTVSEAVTTKLQPLVPSSLSNRKRKQTSSKKKSRPGPSADNQWSSLLLQSINDPAMVNRVSSQKDSFGMSQPGQYQVCKQYLGEAASRPVSSQRQGPAPARVRKKTPRKIASDQVRSDYQGEVDPRITARPTSTDAMGGHVTQLSAAASTTTSSGNYAGSESHFGGLQGPFQLSSHATSNLPPMADQQVNKKGMVASEGVFADSGSLLDLARRQDGKIAAQTKRGEPKARKKNAGKKSKSKKALCESIGEARNGNQETPASPSIEETGFLNCRTFFAGRRAFDACTNIHHVSSRRTTEVRNRKDKHQDHKHQDPFIDEGSQAPLFREHNIVMEREELSDSEEEDDAGVEFEHEEMGDSDKDSEVEVRTTQQDRVCTQSLVPHILQNHVF